MVTWKSLDDQLVAAALRRGRAPREVIARDTIPANRHAAGRRVLLAGLGDAERAALGNALELTGHRVEAVADGDSALARVRASRPNLLILDLLLPGLDGFRVLRELRAEGHEMPVLVLSTRATESDKVLGFRMGADAYVTAPCGVLELLARVEALLRRDRRVAMDDERTMRVSGLEIDLAARTVSRGGRRIELRPRVFELLLALARQPGVAISRRQLLREVWASESGVSTRTVDMHVAHLRRQLGDDADAPQLVITVRKLGYRLAYLP